MDSFSTGSIPSWLIAATAALGPLIALLSGFVSTDRCLRWLFGEKRHCASRERPNGCRVIR
jgi:hypothetical protein